LYDKLLRESWYQRDADEPKRHVSASAAASMFRSGGKNSAQQRAAHRGEADHHPKSEPRHMVGRKAGSITSLSGVEEFEVIE